MTALLEEVRPSRNVVPRHEPELSSYKYPASSLLKRQNNFHEQVRTKWAEDLLIKNLEFKSP